MVDQISCTYRRIRPSNRSDINTTRGRRNGLPHSLQQHKLNKAERNYLTVEREALGMVFALQNYRRYLLANPFIFYTDHQALKYLVNKPLHYGRIFRWLILFQEFGPDHLSRINT